MGARLIFLLIIAAAAFGLGAIPGHALGRRSRRFDGRDGYREGVQAEAARWEAVTGVPFGRLQAWRTGRGPDPFANLAAETEVLPDTGTLLAAADAALGKPPSVAEIDQLAAEWRARYNPANITVLHDEPPVVADITDAARWRPPGMDEIPVVTGRVVTPAAAPDPAWDRAAALPDYAARALGGHRTVDECIDSIVMRAVTGGR